MKPGELLELLQEFYEDRLALLIRHEANAREISQYDFNNTYQYIIAREEVHLSWVRTAIEGLGGSVSVGSHVPTSFAPGQGQTAVLAADAKTADQFVARWRDRTEAIAHARHRGMIQVILGETLEHKRFFELALAGRNDLLGRHADGAGSVGRVMPVRWIE